jgi:hypothetical protein
MRLKGWEAADPRLILNEASARPGNNPLIALFFVLKLARAKKLYAPPVLVGSRYLLPTGS